MSRVGLAIRRRISERADQKPTDEWMDGVVWGYREALRIVDEEIELEAERQFTRPISQQAVMNKTLKEDK